MKTYLYNLFKENDIEIDDDIFDYGCKILKNYFIYFIFLIPIALFLKVLNESLLFVLFYMPLKRYIGGFHFDNPKLCLLFSILTTLAFALLATNIKIDNNYLISFILFAVLIISLLIGTMDHPNKRLTDNEKKFYTKYALIVEIIYFIMIRIFRFFKFRILMNLLILSLCFSTIGIILGKISSKFNWTL